MKRILLITLLALGLAQSSRAANLVWTPTDANWDLTTSNWKDTNSCSMVHFCPETIMFCSMIPGSATPPWSWAPTC